MNNILQYLVDKKEHCPEKIAVSCGDEQYSFKQIYMLASEIASVIRPELKRSPIAVLTARDAHSVILFLAVVMSGNFYIPIDPDLPKPKIQAMLDDADPEYVFGDEQTLQLLDGINTNAQSICFDHFGGEKEFLLDIPELSSDYPLYMVYTSGSTGKPKGVLKSHRAVISFIETYCKTFDFSDSDIIGNQTPLFFDASAKDLYLMLKTGARLEIIPSSHFAMPADLVDFLNDRAITFISWVPSALSIVSQLRIFSYAVPKTLRKIFFVGEVMPVKHLNYWRKYLPDAEYVNLYGQSEIAGVCCCYPVSGTVDEASALPMGKPLDNCKIYLVKENSIISKPGEIGEMYIASDSLAECYYNDPKRTAEAFVVKNFGNGAVRCFKTGDLAMLDEKGNYVFVSRNDFQIKHMGHRIELGEIETIAGSLDQVDRCCCLYNSLKKKIVLFCEASEQYKDVSGREIQSMLRGMLSSYMLPAQVVVLDKLPLNQNGKIDRQKLKEEL